MFGATAVQHPYSNGKMSNAHLDSSGCSKSTPLGGMSSGDRPSCDGFDYDVLIVGAGLSGIFSLYRMRELGLRALVLEAGSGEGGTWYWYGCLYKRINIFTSAEIEAGTGIQVHGLTPRATPTSSLFLKKCWTNGTGQNISHRSPKR